MGQSNHRMSSAGADGTEAISQAGRWVASSIGAALFWRGLRKSGVFGVVTSLTGAALCVYGFTGQLPHELLAKSKQPKSRGANAPTFHDQGRPASQKPLDEVEEASMASFPASDPPASYNHSAS